MSVRPDFVMLGVREPDGSCSIYASTELRHADLVAHREHPLEVIMAAAAKGIPLTALPAQKFDLTAELASYAEGHGASYAEALLDLMRTWQPPDATRALVDEIAAIGAAPEPTVIQRVDSIEERAFDDEQYWFTVHDWNGKQVYDGPGPVPRHLITLTSQDMAAGRAYTFDARPITDGVPPRAE